MLTTSFRIKDRERFLADPDVARLQEHIKSEDGFFEEEPEGWFAFGWAGQGPGTVIQRQTHGDLDICEIIRKHIKAGDVKGCAASAANFCGSALRVSCISR